MIQVTPQMRVLVAVKPADFRKGIDGLARVCREVLSSDPFSGCVFVFCNNSRKAVKITVYDGQDFWLCQKRLSKGRFPWWPQSSAATQAFEAHQLVVLLSGGPRSPALASGEWEPVRKN
jgi:transposase